MATDLKKLTEVLQKGKIAEAWEIIEGVRKCRECGAAFGHNHYCPVEHYAENPPHGAKGHRLSRNCDQCVENGS